MQLNLSVREQQNTTQEDLISTTNLNGGAKTTEGGPDIGDLINLKNALLFFGIASCESIEELGIRHREFEDTLMSAVFSYVEMCRPPALDTGTQAKTEVENE